MTTPRHSSVFATIAADVRRQAREASRRGDADKHGELEKAAIAIESVFPMDVPDPELEKIVEAICDWMEKWTEAADGDDRDPLEDAGVDGREVLRGLLDRLYWAHNEEGPY